MSIKNKNKEELLSNSSTIGYKGIVTIDYIRKNEIVKTIKVHNKGNKSLFSFLVTCLEGRLIEGMRPKILRVYNCTKSETTKYTEAVTTPIIYTSARALDTSIVYKFLIPATAIRKDTKGNYYELNHFRLFSTDNDSQDSSLDDCCAYVDLTTGISPDGVTNYLITWTLQITNIESTGDSN